MKSAISILIVSMISLLTVSLGASVIGDINNDGRVDYTDEKLALQILSGSKEEACGVRPDYQTSGADVNNDNKIGIEEVIYIHRNISQTTYYRDSDGDGYGDALRPTQAIAAPEGYVTNSKDCDDTDDSVHPGAEEICGNGIDDDCNGEIDQGCKPNLTLYQDTGWSSKIVISDQKGTNTDANIIYANENVYIDFIITNYSQTDLTGTFSTILYLDGSQKLKKVRHSLSKMTGDVELDFNLGNLSSGSHTVKIDIDSSNAIDESDESDNIYYRTFKVLPSIPSAPANVSATDGTYNDKIKITWAASNSATGYEVWRSTSNKSTTAVRRASNITNTYYYDTSGTTGTIYYYWVKAKNDSGTSGFSSSDSGYKKVAENPLVGKWGVVDGNYYIYFNVEKDLSITNVSASLPAQKTTYNYGTHTVTLNNFSSDTIDTETYTFSVSKSEKYNYGWNKRSISLNGTFYSTDGVIWVAVKWTATDLYTPEKYTTTHTTRLDKIQ